MIRAGFVLVLAAACAPAAPPVVAPVPEPEPTVEPPALPPAPPGHAWVLIGKNDMGFAVCDAVLGRTSYTRTDLIGGPEQDQVAGHEANHVAFMSLFPDCASFWRWFAEDPHNRRREVEARAYCASVQADVRSGRYTYNQALLRYANKLADQTAGTTTFLAIREMMRFCPTAGVAP